jgi:hypothetical protein
MKLMVLSCPLKGQHRLEKGRSNRELSQGGAQ